MIFKGSKNASKLKEKPFSKEKELQIFFENNIERILDLKFVDTEFSVDEFRLDSLAFDEENKVFIIIEYKNVRNVSLMDQGYTYLKVMLERKADFVLRYNEKCNKRLKINDVDWSQSKIIFVAPSYTKYQINATNFQNAPIDMYTVKRYEGDIIDISKVTKTGSAKVEEIRSEDKQKVNKEIKVYTEEEHLKKAAEEIQELYYDFKERILALDNMEMVVKKVYISFKKESNICDVEIYKKSIMAYINIKKGMLNNVDESFLQDCSKVGHHGNGDYRAIIKSKEDIDAFMFYIGQALKKIR